MTVRQRIFPEPLLSAALFALWLALSRTLSAGVVVVGVALALAVPLMTARLRPTSARVRQPLVIVRFVLIVCRDTVVSNFQVAWRVLLWRWRPTNARFVVIPLDLQDPHGLAALAMVTTVVPGTIWSELALDRSALLLHVWNVADEAQFVAHYKSRYEQPLRQIFE